MSTDQPLVLPFPGERYRDSARLSQLIAPPYDVISTDQRKVLAARDPHNIVHLILPEAPTPEEKYRRAAALLAEWRSSGVLAVDAAPAVYVVAQTFTVPSGQRLTRVGCFGAVAAEPYEARRVLPHEKTHAAPKRDRLELLRATGTNLESIFLLARDGDGALAAALRAVTDGPRGPDARCELDGVEIALWLATGPEGERLAGLASREPLYIADGHHRYETAVAYARERPSANRLLAFMVSVRDAGLTVLPTHRVLYAAGRALGPVAERWAKWFEVKRIVPEADAVGLLAEAGRDRTACLVATPSGDWCLALRPDAPLGELPELGRTAAVRGLDISIVERLVVQEILMAGTSTPTLTYTPDAQQALKLVHESKATAAVLLNPPRVEQVLAVADAADVMPQKSTYFVPKVPSGLVLRPS